MPKWTNSEIKFLKSNYKKMRVKNIAERLDRSEAAVFEKAKKLGLKKRPNPRRWLKKTIPSYPRKDPLEDRRRKLTEQEKEEIRTAYRLYGNPFRLAREYGVSISTIYRVTHPEANKRYLRASARRFRERMKTDKQLRKRIRFLQEKARKERLKRDPDFKKWFKEMQLKINMRNYLKKKGKL